MTFQPLVPLSGVAGLQFIERTQEAQQAAFNNSPLISREIEYFKENIHKAATAEDLTNDYLLRKVALGAFGLDEDLSKKYFINKILDEGTEDESAFANRLVDTRYRDMAETFGYGNLLGANVLQSDFADKIVQAYQTRQFEQAVGDVDNSIRLAMNFKREIGASAADGIAQDTAWYQIMGNTPLRTVFESAFGLPTSIGALDVERQLELFKEKSRALFGSDSLTIFQEQDQVDKLLNDFMVRQQLDSGPTSSTPGFSALSLLQNTGLGTTGTTNLLLSKL